MKKLLALCLTVVLLIAMVPIIGASAADTATFTVGSVEAAPGEEVTVPVSITANPGLTSAQVMVGYDATTLEVVKITGLLFADTKTTVGPTTANPVTVTWCDALNDVTTTGDIATITFKVKEDAADGTYELTVTSDQENVFDTMMNDVPYTTVNGAITVASAPAACEHIWVEDTAVDGALVSDATCTAKALYKKSCSVCGEFSDETFEDGELADHSYGDWVTTKEATTTEAGSKEKTCSACGDKVTEEIPMLTPVNPDAAVFTVGSIEGAPGEEVTVPVSITANPGLTSAQVIVGYDANVLEVVKITGLLFADTKTTVGPTTANPVTVTWCDALNDVTTTGDIATITFKIKEDAADGTYELTVTSDQENVFDTMMNDVPYTTVNGAITVAGAPAECEHANQVIEGAVDATCTTEGSTGVTKCLDCGETIKDAEVIGKIPHAWEQAATDEYKVTDATCTEKATYNPSCSVCGEADTTATFPAGELADHSYGDWVTTKEPTTTEAGSKEKTCSVCGDKVTEEIPMLTPVDPDTAVFTVGSISGKPGEEVTVPVSITANPGLTSAQVIVGYDANVLEVVKITGLLFADTKTTVGPTTANPVYITWCDALNDTTATGDIATITFKIKEDAADGTYELTVTSDEENVFDTMMNNVPYTTVNGAITVEGIVCAHDGATTTHAAVESTCTVAGNEEYVTCDLCGKVISGSDAKLPLAEHTWENEATDDYKVTDATCKDQATYNPNCSVCGAVDTTATFPAGELADHTFVEDINAENALVSAATCTAKAVYKKSCSVCGELSDEEFVYGEFAAHTPDTAVEENRVEATCKAEGSYDLVVKCSECGEEISRKTETIAKLAHTPDTAVEENRVEATCKAEGSYDVVVKCSVCGEEISRETKTIAKLAHTPDTAVEENRVEATCKAEGSYDLVVKCSECGEEISRETKTIAKLDHTGELVSVKEATCTEEGYTGDKVCSVCDEVLEKGTTTAKVAHTLKEVEASDATCDKEGTVAHWNCSVCEKNFADENAREEITESVVIEKLDHKYGDWTVTKEATETEKGSKEKVCSVCGDKVTEEIPMLEADKPAEDDKTEGDKPAEETKPEGDKPAEESKPEGDKSETAPPTSDANVMVVVSMLMALVAAAVVVLKKKA